MYSHKMNYWPMRNFLCSDLWEKNIYVSVQTSGNKVIVLGNAIKDIYLLNLANLLIIPNMEENH